MEIVVHSMEGCPHCMAVKEYLARVGVPFTEQKHDNVVDRLHLYDRWGLVGEERTMPQVFVLQGEESERIGGAADTMSSGIAGRYRRSLRAAV